MLLVYLCPSSKSSTDEGSWYRKVFVSFGGLLLFIEGPYKNLTGLRQDYVYLCLKK